MANKFLRINTKLFSQYKCIFGHLRISKVFVVPEEDTVWPAEFRGTPLGKYAQEIKKLDKQKPELYDPEDRKELEQMGFDWKRIVTSSGNG